MGLQKDPFSLFFGMSLPPAWVYLTKQINQNYQMCQIISRLKVFVK
jgi:hypothetical protein